MPADGATLAANADDLARLYDEYGAKIYRYCLGRLRSKEDAEDAQQNTFLRVYTALRQGTVPAYEAAWLYKIAHNVCLSRVESGAARSRVETPRDLAALEAELAAPSGRRDELIGLEDALAELPANLRQAILLREWQGLSYTEIADALGVSVSAVETLIFRARRRLAQTLEQGVARPAKRVSTALNLPWFCKQLYDQLSRALRSLLSAGRSPLAAAGPAKIVAAAVLVAAGGGGVGAGLALGTSHGTARSEPRASAYVPTLAARRAAPGAGHRSPPAEPARVTGRTSPSLAAAVAAAGGAAPSQAPGVPSALLPQTTTGTAPAPAGSPASGPPEAGPTAAVGAPARGATSAAPPAMTPVATTVASSTSAVATAAIPTVAAPAVPPAPTASVPAISVPDSSAPELPILPTVVDPVAVGPTQTPVAVVPGEMPPVADAKPVAAAPSAAAAPLPAPVTTAVSSLHP